MIRRIASPCAEPAARLPPVHPRKGAGQIRNLFQFAMLFEKSKEKSKIRTWYHKSFLSTSRVSEAWVGGSREAGSYQGDAIRTIEAWWDSPAYTSVGGGCAYNGNYSSGCYQTIDGAAYHTFGVDVSKTVPTAVENRPINVTLPVILYLGLPA